MKPYSCPICKKRFTLNRTLSDHIAVIHTNTGRFRCDWCDKTFRSNSHFVVHLRTHTGEKPFDCKICKKRFVSQSGLSQHHLDVHSKKRFKCGQCGKVFGREANLKNHFLIHSNRRFKCNHCEKSYKSKRILNRHLAYHSNQRKTAGQRFSAPGQKPAAQIEPSNGGPYDLREKRKMPNYQEDQNEFEDSNEEHKSRSKGNDVMNSVSSDESDQDSELLPDSYTVNSINLKLVFDVEYKAPE